MPQRPPLWFYLPPICALLIWWPIGCYWQSDDFLAVAHAHDISNVASDFVGPAFGAHDLWLFYRPLITLSMWLDFQVGGTDPWFAHFTNALAHAVNVLLVGLVWRRFLPDASAALVALVWAAMPSHIGAIAWTVGRVDTHCVIWMLLSVLLFLRGKEREQNGLPMRRWPYVVTTVLGLMTKELTFALPPLLGWLAFCMAPGGIRSRVVDAFVRTWPLWLALAIYMPLRLVMLGGFGGYDAARFAHIDPWLTLQGLGQVVCNVFVPRRWFFGGGELEKSEQMIAWLAAMPPMVALLLAVVRRPKATAVALVVAMIATVPMIAMVTSSESPHNLRYYYLPTAAVVGALACGRSWPIFLMLLAMLVPLIGARRVQHDADRDSARRHAELLELSQRAPPGPLFVQGLPVVEPLGIALQLQFGADRMIAPPFCEHSRLLYPWRPAVRSTVPFRLTEPGESAFALPFGSTWCHSFEKPPERAPGASDLPELEFTGDDAGVLYLSNERLDPLLTKCTELWERGEPSFGLDFPGVRAPLLRVTLFTSVGYIACVFQDHAQGGPDGRLDVLRWLAGDKKRGIEPAAVAPGGLYIGMAMVVPASLDRELSFPTLIEAGDFDPQKGRFVPTHRTKRPLWFRFDREYADWLRRTR